MLHWCTHLAHAPVSRPEAACNRPKLSRGFARKTHAQGTRRKPGTQTKAHTPHQQPTDAKTAPQCCVGTSACTHAPDPRPEVVWDRPKTSPDFSKKTHAPTAHRAPSTKTKARKPHQQPPNAKTAPQCYVGAPACPHTPDPRPELAYRSPPQNWFRSETYRRTGVLVPQRPGSVPARALKLRAGTFGCAGWGTRARWPALYAGGAPAPMPETTFDYCVGFQAAPVE